MGSLQRILRSCADLKNTTDDALPNYLNSLKFKQDHGLTDVRLALGYTAVTIAGILFYADWKLGWDATKAYTLWAVTAYFILNSALTIWIWGIEKGIVYSGKRNGTTVDHLSIINFTAPNVDLGNLDLNSILRPEKRPHL